MVVNLVPQARALALKTACRETFGHKKSGRAVGGLALAAAGSGADVDAELVSNPRLDRLVL